MSNGKQLFRLAAKNTHVWHVRVENYNVEKISYTKQTAEFTELAPESANIKKWFHKGPRQHFVNGAAFKNGPFYCINKCKWP